jgi:hypothetical protein
MRRERALHPPHRHVHTSSVKDIMSEPMGRHSTRDLTVGIIPRQMIAFALRMLAGAILMMAYYRSRTEPGLRASLHTSRFAMFATPPSRSPESRFAES